MKSFFSLLLVFYLNTVLAFPTLAAKHMSSQKLGLHKKTEWQIVASFKFDTLCFLNILTGDPFYLDYYKDEYDQFAPKLTPLAQRALTKLKYEIKEKNHSIISASLSLYFSVTAAETLDEMLEVLIVFILFYSQPHGIKITGTRFLTHLSYPLSIVLNNAVHEMMHSPYSLARNHRLKLALDTLKADDFLMDKILHHNPDFGYNSFDGFIEEDCVQALEQIITEKFKMAKEAHQRWQENDDGMHVFAVALYSLMKQENYNQRRETFPSFLVRMIYSGKLSTGKIKPLYQTFYSTPSPY